MDETASILGWLASLSPDTYVNVMDQYYPAWKARTEVKYKEIGRRIRPEEMEQAFAAAEDCRPVAAGHPLASHELLQPLPNGAVNVDLYLRCSHGRNVG